MNIQEFFNFQGNWSPSVQYAKKYIPTSITVGLQLIAAPLIKDQDNLLALTGDTIPTKGTRPTLELGTCWSVIYTGTHFATANPASGSDQTLGFIVGQLWINTSTNATYIAKSVATGAAVWISLT
jgi:hypothetical protein